MKDGIVESLKKDFLSFLRSHFSLLLQSWISHSVGFQELVSLGENLPKKLTGKVVNILNPIPETSISFNFIYQTSSIAEF